MKDHRFIYSVFMVLVIPMLLFSLLPNQTEKEDLPLETPEQAQTAENSTPLVRVQMADSIRCLELDAYVACVLSGEMPAEFETEALKAQAVAIRTYTLRRLGSSKHPDADVCVDPSCCQAFTEPAGERAVQAVRDTRNVVLTYEGKLIDATYFSCSGGRTEDAVAVWGSDVPYLQSRPSPGEESAKPYVRSISIDSDELLKKLGLDEDQPLTLGEVTYTEGGGVATIEICETIFEGTQFRNSLRLSSTSFQIQPLGDTVVITTKGNGHRVGLSQYGAQAMARNGSDYRQILQHYYLGVTVETWTDLQMQGVFDKAGNL